MPREYEPSKRIGAVFPILSQHVSNLFGRNRDVFVKYTKLNLDSISALVFYVSREQLLIGEAKVRHIERLNPEVAWSRYKERIFLDKSEYDEYTRISPIGKGRRKMSKITVFELKNLRKYKKPIQSIFSVTPSGRYLTNEMMDKIRNHITKGR